MAESDLEVNHAMRDFLPSWAHSSPSREPSCDRVVGEATSRPLTPGRHPFFRQITPNRTSRDLSTESESLLRFNLSSMDLPLSPSRPKSPWGHFDPYDSVEDQDKEYVGFATLPNQVHKKSVKRGFDFTLMVAGESGLGKSTLVNSLFLTDLYKDRRLFSAEERITQTVEITRCTVDIEEKGVKLRLTVVDTPGFGDAINNKECWRPVVDYIEEQFEQYFRDESGLNRKNIQDNRVHCCLYFISPFSHGLRPIDIEFMKALHEKVNIVPVLAKADSLTPYEMRKKKIKIREEMEQHGIKIFQFPDCDSDSDEDFRQHDQELKGRVPFAIIGSNMVVESMGRQVRGRLYPWGTVEVEDPAHSDFLMLRDVLVCTHMQDLKDITRETHYENYRVQCIQTMTRKAARERRHTRPTQDNRADFPIPLTSCSTDSNAERLVWEKEVKSSRILQKEASCPARADAGRTTQDPGTEGSSLENATYFQSLHVQNIIFC